MAVLIEGGPIDDPSGRAVGVLMARTGHGSRSALSGLLDGIVDQLTPADASRVEAHLTTTPPRRRTGRREPVLTAERVEVLRVLMAGGPVVAPDGRAMSVLAARTGRSRAVLTPMVTRMARARLVERTSSGTTTYRIAAASDLSPDTLATIWSAEVSSVT
jgi:hypothetical protein